MSGRIVIRMSGGTFLGCAALLVLAAKLFGFLDVEWLWLLAPIWLPVATLTSAVVLAFVIGALAVGVIAIVDGVRARKRAAMLTGEIRNDRRGAA